jgi:hypothetical protein
VKVGTGPSGMQFPAVLKYCARQLLQNIAKDAMIAVTVLLSHTIDDMKSIDSPNYGQHQFFCTNLLLDFSTDIVG